MHEAGRAWRAKPVAAPLDLPPTIPNGRQGHAASAEPDRPYPDGGAQPRSYTTARGHRHPLATGGDRPVTVRLVARRVRHC